MSPSPFQAYVDVDYIRSLGGEPKVTYPNGHTAYPVTERIKGGLRDRATLDFLTAEPDFLANGVESRFPNNVLTQQIELKCDGPNVEMYYRYERIPGPILSSSIYDPVSGRTVKTTRQTILTADVPSTADGLNTELNGYAAGVAVTTLVNGLVGCTAHGLAVGAEFYLAGLTLNTRSLTAAATVEGSYILACTSTAGFHMGSSLVLAGAIPDGTTVHRIIDATHLEMTHAALATGSGGTVTSDETGMTQGTAGGQGAYFVATVPDANHFTFSSVSGAAANTAPTASAGGFMYRRRTPRGTTFTYAPLGDSILLSVRTTRSVAITDLDYLHGAADRTIPGNHEFRWPDVLDSAFYLAVSQATGGGGRAGDIALQLNITEGPDGKSKALLVERYTTNPAAPGFIDSLPPIQRWFKSAQTLGAMYAYVEGATRSPRAGARTFTIPASIHPAMTVTTIGDNDLYINHGKIDTAIVASYPTAIPDGWIVADIVPQKVEDGLWKYLIIYVRLF